MKAGLASSGAAHTLVLAWAMVSLAAPAPLNVPDVEALPIDIIPFEELTKTVQGAKKADVSPKPAPKPTKAPPRPEPAQNVGETEVDKKADAPVEDKTPPVEKTEAPAPAPKPAPEKTPVPAPKPVPVKAPTPVPTPELAPEPKPKTDIALLLKQTDAPSEEKPVEESIVKLPDKVAAPKQRPTEQKPEAAETNQRKVVDEVKTADSKASETNKKTDATQKAVVNKAAPNAGGAKRSTEKEALGAKKTNNSEGKLAQSEIDAVRGRLEGCWDVGDLTGHADAAKMRAKVEFNLTRSGEIDGRVKVSVSGTDRSTSAALAVRVRSAVTECAPYQLPAEKYDTWSEVVVNFSLQDML